MDIKKSSKASLEDKKSIFILMGFVVALSLIYIAFEWTKHEVTVYEGVALEVVEEEEIEIIQTAEALPPPPPPEVPDVIEVLNVVEDDVETAEIVIDTEDDKDKQVVIQAPVQAAVVEEETEVIFMVVESMPSFPGGEAALFKYLNDNIKYPVIAQESGIQGRVICQFVVNRDGSIVDIEVVRSVDRSLDAEAIRVIQSMPKWTPGKQRGKTVRVKYTLPVNFRLQ
ncbi:MAG: energy transducer TonB [Paludibacter sp.]|nr:energy transducer TonB [Paludibacter sp.]MDD4198363.1 energy transducer TonB [Paludibacter sp.]MDD4428338.1 energy transducer TonB [Paludibacter sp.]